MSSTEATLRHLKLDIPGPGQLLRSGFLLVPARLAQAAVVTWAPGHRENILPQALFSPEALAAWSQSVVTYEHPPEPVTSKNARMFSIGHVVNARQDGTFLAADLVITDALAIREIQAGAIKETSIGAWFSTRPSATPLLAELDVYQALPDHLALTKAGKCGPACSLLHTHTAASPATEKKIMSCDCNTAALTARLASAEAQAATEKARADGALAQLSEQKAGEGARVKAQITLLSEAQEVVALVPSLDPVIREAVSKGDAGYVTASLAAVKAALAAAPALGNAGAAVAAAVAAAGAEAVAPPSLEFLRLASLSAPRSTPIAAGK